MFWENDKGHLLSNVTQKSLTFLLKRKLKKVEKRDFKGFKCMTMSLDVFGDFSRLSNVKDFMNIWIANHSNILWMIPIFYESFQYFVNYSNIYEEFINFMNCILHAQFIQMMNLSKGIRSPRTIFKLIGPCEILSPGQKFDFYVV